MEDVITSKVQSENLDLADTIQYNSYLAWLDLLKDMQEDQTIDSFTNGREWDLAIELNLPDHNYNINWNTLPANYKQMTHLYRQTLQYKKMLEQLPNDPQLYYTQYIEDVRYNPNIIPINYNRDMIVRTLNTIKQIFNLMYEAFLNVKEISEAKKLYLTWNQYIEKNFQDDEFLKYQTNTAHYLAILFADWINANIQPGTDIDLLNNIPESIVGNRCQRNDDSSNNEERPKQHPRKNGDLTKLYPGGIYIQKFNSQSSTPIYEPVHKPKQLQSQKIQTLSSYLMASTTLIISKKRRLNENNLTTNSSKIRKINKCSLGSCGDEKEFTICQTSRLFEYLSDKIEFVNKTFLPVDTCFYVFLLLQEENKTFTSLRLLDFMAQFKLVSFTPKTNIQLNIPGTETQLTPLFSPFKINLYLVQICEEQLAKKKDLTIEDVLVDPSDLIYHKFKNTVIPIVDYSVVIPCNNEYYIDHLYQLNIRNKDMPYNDKLKLGVNPGDGGTGYPVFFTNGFIEIAYTLDYQNYSSMQMMIQHLKTEITDAVKELIDAKVKDEEPDEEDL
ncbi:21362_t:CDS:2 [Cetraspora pellucida]|uniref:21362_t:CDS:1 n=1 Tax=Cetraspora pellucida TaxID=1433469 RepID=A0A9N9H6D9_9GLOM|nr:21362_t:CDS:2 [Cetraspora pellucida]